MSREDEQVYQDAAEAETGDDVRTAVAPPETTPAPPKPKLLPPYKVLLHNDQVNDFEHVICSILKLTSLTVEDAVARTLEAHNGGVSLLLVTHKERGELYCEQFATFNLTVTIEPDA